MALGNYNSLDDLALYYGITRFNYETDEDLYARLKKFIKWKYRTDYFTQVHSLPLQVGLDTLNIMEIKCDGEFEVDLDWEYFTIRRLDADTGYGRVFINTPDATLGKILDLLDTLNSDYDYVLYKPHYRDYAAKNLVRNKSKRYTSDIIPSKSYNLEHNNIVDGSIACNTEGVLLNKVDSLQDIRLPGDYYIDLATGFIQLYEEPASTFSIGYEYYEPRFIMEYTDVNLIPVNLISKYGLTDDLIEAIPYLLNGKTWGY